MNQLIDISTPVVKKKENSTVATTNTAPYPDFTPNISKALAECFKRRKESLLPQTQRRPFFALEQLGRLRSDKQVTSEVETGPERHAELQLEPQSVRQVNSTESELPPPHEHLTSLSVSSTPSQMDSEVSTRIAVDTLKWRDLTTPVLKAIQLRRPPDKTLNHENKENFLDEQHTRLNMKTLELSGHNPTPRLVPQDETRKRTLDSPGTPSNLRNPKQRRILGQRKQDSTNVLTRHIVAPQFKSTLSNSTTESTDDTIANPSDNLGLESIFQRAVEQNNRHPSEHIATPKPTDQAFITPKIVKVFELQQEITKKTATKTTSPSVSFPKASSIFSCIDQSNSVEAQLQDSQFQQWVYQKRLEHTESLVEYLELERRFHAY